VGPGDNLGGFGRPPQGAGVDGGYRLGGQQFRQGCGLTPAGFT